MIVIPKGDFKHRYYNREFAIPGRPPETKDFPPVSQTGPELRPEYFPGENLIRYGLDPMNWNGAVLLGRYGGCFGVAVGYFFDGRLIDDERFYEEVRGIGRYDPDGRYACVETNEIRIEWAKNGDDELIGKVTAKADITAKVRALTPLHGGARMFSEYAISGNELRGESVYTAVIAGTTVINGGHSPHTGRYLIACDPKMGKEYFRLCQTGTSCQPQQDDKNGVYYLKPLTAGEALYFSAFIGSESIYAREARDAGSCEAVVREAESVYCSRTTLRGKGALAKHAQNILNQQLSMSIYYPYLKQILICAGRPWHLEGNYSVAGWDESFSGLIVSYYDLPELTKNQLLATHGDERMGLIAIWNAYVKDKDKETLRRHFEAYKTVYPSDNTDLIYGYNDVGKGMDDTPMREVWSGKGDLYSIDMSCYKIAGFEVLYRAAKELGLDEDAAKYKEGLETLKKKFNEMFWNEEKGLYMNRYVCDLSWPQTISPTSFYPLFVGVADGDKAERLIKVLLDPKKFWGKYVIPTLSRDDPEYGKESRIIHHGRTKPFPPYCYWRGAIWPPSNYLVFMGLQRYGFDEIMAEFAEKNVNLWDIELELHGGTCENYYPETGLRTLMSHKHQSWSPLIPLTGVTVMLDADMWNDYDSISFGTVAPGEHEVTDMKIRGDRYSVSVNDTETVLRRNGRVIFTARGGKCAFHNYRTDPADGVEFDVNAKSPLEITAEHRGKTVSTSVPAGRTHVKF